MSIRLNVCPNVELQRTTYYLSQVVVDMLASICHGHWLLVSTHIGANFVPLVGLGLVEHISATGDPETGMSTPSTGWVTKRRARILESGLQNVGENDDWQAEVLPKLHTVYKSMPCRRQLESWRDEGWPPGKATEVMTKTMENLWEAILYTPLAALLMVQSESGNWARKNMKKVWQKMKQIMDANPGPIVNTIRRMEDDLLEIKGIMKYIAENVLLVTGVLQLLPCEVLEYLDTIEKAIEEELNSRTINMIDGNSQDNPLDIRLLEEVPLKSAEQVKLLTNWNILKAERKITQIASIKASNQALAAIGLLRAQVEAAIEFKKNKIQRAVKSESAPCPSDHNDKTQLDTVKEHQEYQCDDARGQLNALSTEEEQQCRVAELEQQLREKFRKEWGHYPDNGPQQSQSQPQLD